MKSRIMTVLERRAIVAGLGAMLLPPVAARAAERAGEVESSRGDCYAMTAAARRALEPAAAVYVGDAVGTGEASALGMHLGTATEVRLGPMARLRIDRFLMNAGGVLELQRGGMLFDRDTKTPAGDLSIRSPFGLIAVRGTRFFAGPSAGRFGVFVQRGAVTVVGPTTAVLVGVGFGTDIARPGDEPTTPAPWGAARIDAALASVA
jgi:hypothetical protein